MQAVNVLLRCIVRALYETEHAVIVELLIHYKGSVRMTAREISEHLPLSQIELSGMCDDLCSNFLISSFVASTTSADKFLLLIYFSRVHEASGKPCYYIDPQLAVLAVRWRLMEIKRIVDTGKDPMDVKALECQYCKIKLSMAELYYPAGEEGFLCPKCNSVLLLLAGPASSSATDAPTIRDDLGYFFGHLKEADEACKEGTLEKRNGECALKGC